MYQKDGNTLGQNDTYVTPDGTQFPPASWRSRMDELGIVWVDDPAPIPQPWSREPLLKVVRAGREIALNRLSGIAFAAREAGDSDTVQHCLAARAALLNITGLPSVLSATNDASLTAAVGYGYAAIVAACPANITAAFAGIQS